MGFTWFMYIKIEEKKTAEMEEHVSTLTIPTSVSVQTRGRETRVTLMWTSVTDSGPCLTWAVRTEPRVSTFLEVTRVPVPQDTTGSTVGTEATRVVVGRHKNSVAMDNVWTRPVGHSHTRVSVMKDGPTTVTQPRVVRMSMNVLCQILHVPKTPW